jgi:hypothetical protein
MLLLEQVASGAPVSSPAGGSTGTERPMVVTCACSPQALIACWSDTPWDDTQCAGRARHWDQLGSLPGSVMTGSSGQLRPDDQKNGKTGTRHHGCLFEAVF